LICFKKDRSGDGHLSEKINLYYGHLSDDISEHLSEKINLYYGHLSDDISEHLSDTISIDPKFMWTIE
jgi:hypothetical protein